MDNPFAKFFGENKKPDNSRSSEAPITVGGKPLTEYNDDLPPGAEYVDEDCEGCECGGECDCGGECRCHVDSKYDDLGVIEKQAGDKHPGGTLADNARLGQLNKGYVKASKEVQARRAGKITFKK